MRHYSTVIKPKRILDQIEQGRLNEKSREERNQNFKEDSRIEKRKDGRPTCRRGKMKMGKTSSDMYEVLRTFHKNEVQIEEIFNCIEKKRLLQNGLRNKTKPVEIGIRQTEVWNKEVFRTNVDKLREEEVKRPQALRITSTKG